MSDSWPKIRVPRFDDESSEEYVWRRDRIVEIVNNFRHRPMSRDLADRLDVQLDRLLSGDTDYGRRSATA